MDTATKTAKKLTLARVRLRTAKMKVELDQLARELVYPECVWCGAVATKWDGEGGWCDRHYGTY